MARSVSVNYSSMFLKHMARLPNRLIKQADEKESLFREFPFHPSLRVHKLTGREKDCWAFWINYKYRVKFIFLSNEEVLFLDVGTHGIYQ